MVEWLSSWVAHYGYWAIAIVLLLENVGLPVPGETVLLLAGFLASSQRKMELPSIIFIGIAASTSGGSLGYLAGRRGGRSLIERYRRTVRGNPKIFVRGERLFARHGVATILVSRFIVGLRIIAAPLAGALGMRTQIFLLANFLGSVLWVTVIASAGYFFGEHWNRLVSLMGQFNIAVALAAIGLAGIWKWKWRRAQT